jgi:hypothetical protein
MVYALKCFYGEDSLAGPFGVILSEEMVVSKLLISTFDLGPRRRYLR